MDQRLFGAQGYMGVCENYHLDRGLRKRKGDSPYVADAIGAAGVQGLAMYEWDDTRYLLGLANGVLSYKNGASWSAITGALSPTVDNDALLRTAHFHDGTNRYIVGCLGAGNSAPFLWSGAGNATALSATTGTAPTYANDVAEFRDHLFFINTPAGVSTVQFGNYGLVDEWPLQNNLIDCTRNSIGIGLAAHDGEVLLAFYHNSIHRITYNYGDSTTGNFFQSQGVPGMIGCASRSSIITFDGITYFVGRVQGSEKGIYAIRDPFAKPKYISRPIEGLWNRLTKNRRQYMSVVPLPQSNEIAWLCSLDGSATHNAALIYNVEKDGWSLFNSPYAALTFNSGCLFRDSDGQEVTILGDYDGIASHAWGDDTYDTGNLDGGETGRPVRSKLESGFLDLGSRRRKANREVHFNLESLFEKNFDCTLETVADVPQSSTTVSLGASGARLSQTFVLGASQLAGDGTSHGKAKLVRSGRYFRLSATEESTEDPHTLTSIHFKFKIQGARI